MAMQPCDLALYIIFFSFFFWGDFYF
uniref:Uncharacterized protein n=1 Tax=Anguilla anguilla TaxID=7936 RepID=A0A0E9QMI2_ANGAN